jgi:hypothetical protein
MEGVVNRVLCRGVSIQATRDTQYGAAALEIQAGNNKTSPMTSSSSQHHVESFSIGCVLIRMLFSSSSSTYKYPIPVGVPNVGLRERLVPNGQ